MTPKLAAYRWADLPKRTDANGPIRRAGFRQNDALLVFTWTDAALKRLAPQRVPFDIIVLNFDGRQYAEIDGRAYLMTPRSMLRVPANALFTHWPAGPEAGFHIQVHTTQSAHMPLASWQDGFAAPPTAPAPAPRTVQDFAGAFVKDTSGVVFEWDKLKREPKYDGHMTRTAFKSRHSLVTFNFIQPTIAPQPPHNHPFDQIVMVADGTIGIEIEGTPLELGPRSIAYVPTGMLHAGGPNKGVPVLNIDVFSPARADYVHLADYQGKL